MKVFISSLIGEYEDQRAAVGRAAHTVRCEVIQAEDFGARPETPQQACLKAVESGRCCLLLLGARYGQAQESGLSATHEEWREAQREEKPTLLFVESVDRESADPTAKASRRD